MHISRFQSMVTGSHKYLILLSVDVRNDARAYAVEDMVDKLKHEILKQIDGEADIYIEVKDSTRSISS
jgi:divalent metal cation (Fe/Co/Zn/Cd) transporter